MTFADALARLETGLRSPLPGPSAQAHLAPVPRRAWPPGHTDRIRDAAGLLLVFPRSRNAEFAENAENNNTLRSLRSLRSTSDEAHIILTVRADALRHGGQVSLPGGGVDPGETFEQAALREAHEEVALPLDDVRVLGALTPMDIPVSGFRLHPFVATRHAQPELTASDGEVARILEVDVDDLMNPAHLIITKRTRDGVTFTVPAFRIHGAEIWGATAMILAEFLVLLGWSGPQRA